MKIQMTLLALLALGACGKDKESKESGEAPAAAKTDDGKPAAKKSAKPAAAGPMKIEALGLMIDVPAGSTMSEMAGSQLIKGDGLVVGVKAAGQFTAETLAAELEEAKDMYTATNVTQEEVEGGWHVTFENKGGMGTNYWVKSHLTFDGKAYTCGTTSSTKEQQAAALAACKSLKK
jgi:hypothetical protein